MKEFLKKVGKGFKKVGHFLFVKEEKTHSEKYEKVIAFLNKFSIIGHALLACFVVFMIEVISRRDFLSACSFVHIHPIAFIYNAFIVFATLMVAYFFRRRAFIRTMVSAMWMILGIANGCILSNRVTPFSYTDLSCIGDILTMKNSHYFTTGQATLLVFGSIAFLLGMVFFFIHGPRYQGKINKIAIPISVVTVICVGLPVVTDIATSTNVVETYYANIAQGYQDNGFVYSFSSSVVGRGMDKPSDYSEESVADIESDVTAASETTDSSNPNIICILLESVVDPDEINYLSVNEDPIPTLHSLAENYTDGYLTVPVVGAGTANTEFEVLTGMSMQYFGTGEYPYKTVLKQIDSCESAASDLSSIGYSTHVVHNNGGNFYSRANAFELMGFDTFTSKEMMDITEWTPLGSWAEDDILVSETMKALESTEGSDFCYTITVGTHGAYPTEEVLEDPEYVATGAATQEQNNQWTYYVNQLHKTDEFVKNLIASVEESGEDTVIVMFGDHLPTMGLTDDDMKSGSIYKTKYWTWNNMGLEQEDADLYAYQLLASTTDSVGIHEGTMLTYHQTMMNSLTEDDYLSGLEMLQYDLLYGERYAYNGENLYPASDLVMGIDDVVIENVELKDYTFTPDTEDSESDEETDATDAMPVDSYTKPMIKITGQSFTNWSKVFINGEKVSTTYVDGNTLLISPDDIADGDTIVVNQMGSSNTIFRSSNEYIYQAPASTETSETSEAAK